MVISGLSSWETNKWFPYNIYTHQFNINTYIHSKLRLTYVKEHAVYFFMNLGCFLYFLVLSIVLQIPLILNKICMYRYTNTYVYTAFLFSIYLCAIKCIYVLKYMDMYTNKIYFEISSCPNQNEYLPKNK